MFLTFFMLYNNKLYGAILNLHTKTFVFLIRVKLFAEKNLKLTFKFLFHNNMNIVRKNILQ